MQGSAAIWATTHLNLAHALRKIQCVLTDVWTRLLTDPLFCRFTAGDMTRHLILMPRRSDSTPSATAPSLVKAWFTS